MIEVWMIEEGVEDGILYGTKSSAIAPEYALAANAKGELILVYYAAAPAIVSGNMLLVDPALYSTDPVIIHPLPQ